MVPKGQSNKEYMALLKYKSFYLARSFYNILLNLFCEN